MWISPYCNCLSTIHMTSLITSLSGSDSADAWYASTGVHSTFSLWIYLFLTSLMSDLSASNVASSCCFYSNTEQSKVLVIKEWVAPICRPTLPTARSRCSLISRGIHVVIFLYHCDCVTCTSSWGYSTTFSRIPFIICRGRASFCVYTMTVFGLGLCVLHYLNFKLFYIFSEI